MTYKYTATAADNRLLNGTIVAESEDEAEEALYAAGYANVLTLKKTRPPLSFSQMLPSVLGAKPRDIIDLSLQLADLLESGVDLRYIQELLGHRSSKTTEVYTHVTRRDLGQIPNPLDSLMEGPPDGPP